MNISVGIVGLPNVGKSTLFNALTNNQADAQNYPFCTISPNNGIVKVEDKKLDKLSEVSLSKSRVNAAIEFVDIAGLVKGASEGAGLGNQFLANIREVAAIAHVVREFENDNIIHVDGKIDPLADIDTINTELILKDLDTLEKRMSAYIKQSRGDKKYESTVKWLEGLRDWLSNGKFSFEYPYSESEIDIKRELSLLTDKPVIFVVNVLHGQKSTIVEKLRSEGKYAIPMDIKLEYEISLLSQDERIEYLKEFGLEGTGIDRLAEVCYDALGLISFYTSGEQESRAWTIKKGATAQDAAGTIHTDFAKNFIAAEVTSFEDFVNFGGWNGVKNNGKIRLEGRNYIVKPAEVFFFKHN